MVHRRVVVTGMGIVAPQCRTLVDLWNLLNSGAGAVRPYNGYGLVSHAAPADHVLELVFPSDTVACLHEVRLRKAGCFGPS